MGVLRNLAPKKQAFLAAYGITGNISTATEASGVVRQTHYDWLESDPDYQIAFAEAQKQSVEMLEAEARRRAVEGVRKLKFHQGSMVMVPTGKMVKVQEKNDHGEIFESEQPEMVPYVEHEYSDVLLIVLLKAHAPQKYRDNLSVKHEFDGLSDQELISRAAGLFADSGQAGLNPPGQEGL